MGMESGMDRVSGWIETAWRVWQDAPELLRYAVLFLLAVYGVWLVLFFRYLNKLSH